MKQFLFLFIATALLFTACKKEQGESIDYTATTEERIKVVSEQPTISDDDIASLERLLQRVPAGTDQTRLATLLESVKLIKDFIPAFEKLRTDPEINFQETYAELENSLKEMSDQLPRKEKLRTALADALASYSTEEYTYTEQIINGMELGTFLADNHNVHPVEGKPYSYLKKDIDAVDSLFFPLYEQVPFSVIKTFKGLRALTVMCKDETLNLNHLKNLEYLNVDYGKKLLIDSCQQLKHLEITADPYASNQPQWGETLDFTDKYPLLETLILPKNISEKLVTILLPAKQHLKLIRLSGTEPSSNLPNIKKLVIEINGAYDLSLTLGSDSNKEIEEVRIAGLGGIDGETSTSGAFFITGNSLSDINSRVRIKNITLTGLDDSKTPSSNWISIGALDLDKLPDLSSLLGSQTQYIMIDDCRLGEKPDFDNIDAVQLEQIKELTIDRTIIDGGITYADYNSLFQKLNPETVESILLTGLSTYPGKIADLSRFKKLNQIALTSATAKDGQILNKVILNKAVEGNYSFYHSNAEGVAEPVVQVEFK